MPVGCTQNPQVKNSSGKVCRRSQQTFLLFQTQLAFLLRCYFLCRCFFHRFFHGLSSQAALFSQAFFTAFLAGAFLGRGFLLRRGRFLFHRSHFLFRRSRFLFSGGCLFLSRSFFLSWGGRCFLLRAREVAAGGAGFAAFFLAGALGLAGASVIESCSGASYASLLRVRDAHGRRVHVRRAHARAHYALRMYRAFRASRLIASLHREIFVQFILLVFVLIGLHLDVFILVVEIVIVIFWPQPVVQRQSVLSFRTSYYAPR